MKIKTIVERCGGYSSLGKELGISRQAVFSWKKVPIKYLRTVKKLSKLTFKQLRPDIWGN
jgi:hypothetical protein